MDSQVHVSAETAKLCGPAHTPWKGARFHVERSPGCAQFCKWFWFLWQQFQVRSVQPPCHKTMAAVHFLKKGFRGHVFIKAKWKCNWLFIAGLLRALSFSTDEEERTSGYTVCSISKNAQSVTSRHRLPWDHTGLTIIATRLSNCHQPPAAFLLSLSPEMTSSSPHCGHLVSLRPNPPMASDFTKRQNPNYNSQQASAGGVRLGSRFYRRSFFSRYPQC